MKKSTGNTKLCNNAQKDSTIFMQITNADKESKQRNALNTVTPKKKQQKRRYQPSVLTKANGRALTANPDRTGNKGEKADTK